MRFRTIAWVLAATLAACSAADKETDQDKVKAAAEITMPPPGPLPDDEVVISEQIRLAGADGNEVIPAPAIYKVAAKGENLALTREGLDEVILLAAQPIEHENTFEKPRAVVVRQEKGKGRRVALLFADGKGLESLGHVGAGQPRGWFTYRYPVIRITPKIQINSPASNYYEYFARTKPLEIRYYQEYCSYLRIHLIRHGDNQISASSPTIRCRSTKSHGIYRFPNLHHLQPQWYRVLIESTNGAVKTYGSWFHVRGPNVSIAAGRQHFLALGPDSQLPQRWHMGSLVQGVWASGNDERGQLGQRQLSGTEQANPAALGIHAIALTAGRDFSLALDPNGTVYSWGDNKHRQLGRDEQRRPTDPFDASSYPTVIPGLSDVVSISAGWHHALALKRDGTVWAWGWNYRSQCAQPATLGNVSTPTQVRAATGAALDRVVAISAGKEHSVALRDNGEVWAWGSNRNGQLDPDLSILSSPVALPVRQEWWPNGIVMITAADNGTWVYAQAYMLMFGPGDSDNRNQAHPGRMQFWGVHHVYRNHDRTPVGEPIDLPSGAGSKWSGDWIKPLREQLNLYRYTSLSVLREDGVWRSTISSQRFRRSLNCKDWNIVTLRSGDEGFDPTEVLHNPNSGYLNEAAGWWVGLEPAPRLILRGMYDRVYTGSLALYAGNDAWTQVPLGR